MQHTQKIVLSQTFTLMVVGKQKKLAGIVCKHFHVFKHSDLGNSADWSLLLDFHNHGNAGEKFEILHLSYGQVIARLCGTKSTKTLFLIQQ